jgi:hypothetical protein
VERVTIDREAQGGAAEQGHHEGAAAELGALQAVEGGRGAAVRVGAGGRGVSHRV